MITAPDFQKKQIVVVFFNDGEKMSILNDNLIVKDKNGKVKLQCTCYRLFLVFAIGSFSITSVVVQRAKKFGFFIACMTSGFRLYDVIGAYKEGNILLKSRQYKYKGNDIGLHIIKNKVLNQRFALMSNRNKDEGSIQDIRRIDEYIIALDNCENLNELLAYEGLSAKLYFKNHFNNIEWKGRTPRLKLDYINSALDIGYTLLFSFIDAILESYGFDVYVGVLHKQFYMRKSLVCDLVEPFRCLIDWQVKKSINLNQIQEDDFELINNQWQLKYKFSAKYVKILLTPIIENKDVIFKYIQDYYYSFMKGYGGDSFPIFKME